MTHVHPAFEWLRSEKIASLNLTVEEYLHKKTGAQHFHLSADNPENVFFVALRTVPQDSTGVAHILEHTALCGSERYPVRDPFFMMIRRSLNTFMNAFTSSDWTAYPFASKNRKDFGNLIEVYLDAVFFSRLDELDFAQEGHRVEFEKPEDPAGELVFKGVVYNEMKGAMSSPVSTLWHTLCKYLFPTSTYHYNSGGDPESIPDLTHQGLKSFYRTHYHPSNSIFMTYGDIPAFEHHRVIDAQALCRFDRLEERIAVGDEKRYCSAVNIEESYALDDGETEGKTHIVLGWLLGKSTELKALLKAHLLSSVLLENGASPLRHALETTELGAAPSPLCGLEDSNREISFVCGLEGSSPEHALALEKLVFEVLEEVAAKGVPFESVEAALHQIELSQREISGDGHPYGLQLILNALSPAIHGGDPVSALNIDPVLEELREEIRDPDFIKKLVAELLLDNAHRVRLTLKPDTGLSKRRKLAEKARLEAIRSAMSETEKTAVIERARALAQRQAQQDDPEILPKVGLDDVPPEISIPSGSKETVGKLAATFFDQGTNGLLYQQILADLPDLDESSIALLPYYTSCLTELGCGGRDYLETQAWQSAVTGGINAYTSIRGNVDDEQVVKGYFILSGKALTRNRDKLSELMRQTLETVRFDETSRIREIIAQERASREQSVTGQGHSLAMAAAASGMSPAAMISHRLNGLSGIKSVKDLDDSLEEAGKIEEVAANFRRIHEAILNAPRQMLVVGEAEHRASLKAELEQRWEGGESGKEAFSPFFRPATRSQVRQIWVASTQVNFCAKAYPTVPGEHPHAPALSVLGGFLRNGYLHRAIREQGGAYGGGAGHDSDIAAFRFYSYRDPRLQGTLDDFDKSIEWLLSEKHEWREVEEAILGVIGSIDKPGSPAGEAKQAFHNALFGRTAEQRQRFRARVLKVTLEDLLEVGKTYLVPEKASIAVITSQATLDSVGDLGMEVFRL
ncbi:MAG: insulinase family protein [Burkholderiales bacterium]|nr:insulinase family protein [Burkholderiales bacterium]